MRILLSIKPEYADKIFEGRKKYEYRRSIFKNKTVDTVIVYATKPVSKVIGEFKIKEILEADPKEIWDMTQEYSGIDKSRYEKYFSQKDKGFAISIKNTKLYKKPLELADIRADIKYPPQSFIYI